MNHMKLFKRSAAGFLAAFLVFGLCACTKDNMTESASSEETSTSSPTEASGSTTASETTDSEALRDPEDSSLEAEGEFVVKSDNASAVSVSGSIYTISAAGEYTLSGNLSDGQIVVDAGEEDEVVLILSDASISSSTGAAILGLSAGELTVKSEEGSYNTVTDLRAASEAASEDEDSDDNSALNDDAVIYSKCDLKLTGKGTLIVTGSYDNGIKSTKDLSIKNVSLKVTAPGTALKGNDSVTVKSGSVIAISTASDGVKTRDSDVSSKGNQRGTILIEGGELDVYAAKDGLSAACNVEITPAEGENPIVRIYTGTYSDYAGEAESGSDLYLVLPADYYDENSDYYFYFYDDDDTAGSFVKAEYDTMIYSGRTPYYGLLAKSTGSSNLLIHVMEQGVTPDGSNYSAASAGEAMNASMNGYLVTDLSSGTISGDWVSITYGDGSSDKTTFSSKGIKAANSIILNGGSLTVQASDDGLHANAGETLDNGEESEGSIVVNGGTLEVTCADDGLHADGVLSISGGEVNVIESHEGLEGNVIRILGGETHVYGNDDGLNAGKGAETPLIDISGGILEVTTPSGDTDGIDSNGNITISGGTVFVKCGAQMGGMAGSIDLDGTITVTGGTVIALGGICETPGSDSVNTYISSGTSFSTGAYAVKDSSTGEELLSFELESGYTSLWIASEKLEQGSSYILTQDETELLSWTQSAQTEGSAGYSGGYGGGHGGFGGRR